MLINCPRCHARVALNPDGCCPHCGQNVSRVIAAAAELQRTGASRAEEVEVHNRWVQDLHAATPRVYMTQLLVAVNVAVFVIMVLSGVHILNPATNDLIKWGAIYGPLTIDDQWWRIFTAVFVHIGVIHLAMNMWVLWQIGRFVERLLGNVGFLLLYLISGVGGSLASLWWNPQVVGAGASGAIFGVIGALVGFVVMQRRTIPPAMMRSLRQSGVTFVIYCVIIAVAIRNIDHAAHLGGLITGFLGGLVVSQPVRADVRFGRLVRNGLVAVLAAVGIAAAIVALPPAPVGTEELVNDVKARLRAIPRTYDQADVRHQQGELTDDEFADVIENEILPQLPQLIADLETLESRDHIDAKQRERTVRIRELWRLQVKALRESDPQRKQKLVEEFEQAAGETAPDEV